MTLQGLTRGCPSITYKHGGMYRETCRGEIDFRIQGLPHSAVQEHDHIRKQAVQKLIHQFANHPNKEALQEDLQQKRAFNPFSEKSKEMIYTMGNIEYFETCEITPNITVLQLYDRLADRYCVLAHAEHAYDLQTRFEKLNSDRCDVRAIPNYVIDKGTIPWETPRKHGKTENLLSR